MKHRIKNIHPGEVLMEEFLLPLGISAYRLAKDIGIPQTRISEILKGRRKLTADTCVRLSAYFGNSAQFWMGLQSEYDIEETSLQLKQALHRITTLKSGLTKRKTRATQRATRAFQ